MTLRILDLEIGIRPLRWNVERGLGKRLALEAANTLTQVHDQTCKLQANVFPPSEAVLCRWVLPLYQLPLVS